MKETLMVFTVMLFAAIGILKVINQIPGTGTFEIILMIVAVLGIVYIGMRLWAKVKDMPDPFRRK